MDLLKFQQLGTHNFSNPMITHLNVLGSRVKTWILGKMDSALAIAKQIVVLTTQEMAISGAQKMGIRDALPRVPLLSRHW